jgi:hypothetical protein
MKANLAYWRSVLRQAEAALDTAATRSAVNDAAFQLMLAKAQLKRLQAATGSASAGTFAAASGRACDHP